jgi:hypothetical protein
VLASEEGHCIIIGKNIPNNARKITKEFQIK